MKEGYTITELGEIPENWIVAKWEDICEICYGKDQKQVENTSGIYPIYGTGGIMSYSNRYLNSDPSVLIGRKGTIDKPIYIDKPFWTVDTLFYTKMKEDISAKWFYYLVCLTPLRKYNEATGVPSLSRGNLYNIKAAVPPLPEQQKIANILSTVDEKIEIIDAQITQTRELKKGLMQKLLTRGFGHTKFKDSVLGEIPESWEIINLVDVCKLQGGYAFKSADSCEDGVRWLKIANVGINKISWEDKSFLPSDFHDEYADYVLNEGDVVIAMTRPILGIDLKIAKIGSFDSGALLNQRVGRLVVNQRLNIDFAYQVLTSNNFITKLQKELLGTDPPNISSSTFESLSILLPPLEEQLEISAILNTLDDKLKVLQSKKESYQELKKGLMQQLLTGKVRVFQSELETA